MPPRQPAAIAYDSPPPVDLRVNRPRTLEPEAVHVREADPTDQATREASGARPYGRYLEDFEVGAVYKHWPAKTVTEADDHLFCLLTVNHHPLHINDVYAAQSQQGRNVVRMSRLSWNFAMAVPVVTGRSRA